MGEIRNWQYRVHKLSRDNGFYEAPNQTIDQKLMLIVGELSEAHEELRNGRNPTEVYNASGSSKPEGFGVELADAVIRIMDLCEWQGIDLEELIAMKHDYNCTRPYKHGKVF